MAINKRKALNAARKYAQKGAKEKALKEYTALLKADPRDAKLRLEIGDAYRRWGQIEDAITHYVRVAEQYKDEGFDARAVAVFKQILNLDSKRYPAYVSLSELYQRIGLESEAINALQCAADGYREQGDTREALELLRKMASLDPGNTTSRIKIGDLLGGEGMTEDAVSEYEAVIEELKRVGDNESIPSIYERILEIVPTRTDLLFSLARALMEQGDASGAESYAQQACEADPEDTNALELLGEVYQLSGRTEELAESTRKLAQLFRDRGDDGRAREIMQRLPSSALEVAEPDLGPTPEEFAAQATSMDSAKGASIDAGDGEDLLLSDEELLGGEGLGGSQDLLDGEDLLADEEFLEGTNTDFELGDSDSQDGAAAEPEADDATPPAAPVPTGDPDQLLAEASVYLRYGKLDQARASLDAALAQEPDHRGVLDKLGELFVEHDESAKAVEVWQRSALIAVDAGDTEAFQVVRDRIAAIDPEAASTPPDPAANSAANPPDDPNASETLTAVASSDEQPDTSAEDEMHGIEFDIEVDLDLDVDASELSAGDSTGSSDQVGEDTDAGIEIEIEQADLSDSSGSSDSVSLSSESSQTELRDISEDSIGGDAVSGMATGGSASLSATTSQQIGEDLEEAEFYFQQDLFDEAEAIYQRVLAVAPNHPSAMVRLGEIAATRGEDPSARYETSEDSGQSDSAEVAADESSDYEIEIDGSDDSDDEVLSGDSGVFAEGADDLSLSAPAPEDLSSSQVGEAEAPSEDDCDDVIVEIDVDLGQTQEVRVATAPEADESVPDVSVDESESAEAEAEVNEIEADATEAEEAEVEESEDEESDSEETVVDEAEDSSEAPLAAADDATFDLAAELRDALEEEDAAASGQVLSTVEDGFASIFSDFKKGVSEQLSDEDHETRYDLGIAYREMGLLEDAIGEFHICLGSSGRRIDSLQMLALCALDGEQASQAVGYLEQALASPDIEDQRRPGFYFDLGRAFEQVGDSARARASYQAIDDADFPGVAERLAALEDTNSVELVAPGEAPEEEPEEEQYESFDDMMAEVEAMDIVDQAESRNRGPHQPSAAQDTTDSEDQGELAASKASDTKKKKKPRKRKISFV